MKTGKTFFMAILAIIFTLTFVNCDNGGGPGKSSDGLPVTRDPVSYTGTDGGVTYTLKIEDGSGRAVLTPRANDKYTLTAGGKTSTGIVNSFINGILDLKPSNAQITFKVTISGSGNIIELTGTITYTDNSTAQAPGAVAPGDGSFKLNFKVARYEPAYNGDPGIDSNTRYDLLLKDYFGGTLKKGAYYTIKISGTLDKAIVGPGSLMFYFFKDGDVLFPEWVDNTVGDWNSEVHFGSTPAGPVNWTFKILINPIRDDVTIQGKDITIHLGYYGDGAFDNLPDDTITATISNFKMTINEWTDDETDEGGEGTDPGNGGDGGTGSGNGDVSWGLLGFDPILDPLSNEIISYRVYADLGENGLDYEKRKKIIGALDIPAEHKGKPVTHVDGFQGCENLTSVTIPASVKYLWLGAFGTCAKLRIVTFAAGSRLEYIGLTAFYNCPGLTGITIPNSVTEIGEHAFHGCTGITEITIPPSVTTVGHMAFYGWTSSQTINVPFANAGAKPATWYDGWEESCNAVIKYSN